MIGSIFALVLVLLGLFALALQRFYSCVPAKELKRLAARGDHLAVALYRPVAYGESMRLLLWVVFGASLTGGFLLFSENLVALLAYVAIGLSLAGAIAIQSLRLTVHSARLAVTAAPALNWLLTYFHTPFDTIAQFVNRRRVRAGHSGLYEKEDIVSLLRQQKEQPDNRIDESDLELLERVASFDDHQAADVAQPMSRLKLVKIDDHIGPILLGELHASGQGSFLVYQDTTDQVVGTLLLRDAVQAREGGRVADIMRPSLNFVHEDFSLRQVVNAFTRTGQSMLVVINASEEAVGVISLQHLLAQIFGTQAADDFTAYDDRAAVAAYRPEPAADPVAETGTEAAPTEESAGQASEAAEATESEPAAEDVPPSPDATEVVE